EIVEQSYELLKDLPLNKKREKEGKPPANILLPRGAAIKLELPSIKELYGINGVAIAAGALYIGIAKAIGLRIKRAEATVLKQLEFPSVLKGAYLISAAVLKQHSVTRA
ncbi:unnamed protein product, partial [marine sediment metagenome]